jgi:hypothetical protein
MSEDDAQSLAHRAGTIGHFMSLIRNELIENESLVSGLLAREKCRLWTVVAAGGEARSQVTAVTRGTYGHVDMDRLLAATDANVVTELRKYPHRVGMLGTSLDARVFYLDPGTSLAVARLHGAAKLHAHMEARGLATTLQGAGRHRRRIGSTDLGRVLAADRLGGIRADSRSTEADEREFASLLEIARTNDGHLNRALGEALVADGLIELFESETTVGEGLRFASDLRLVRGGEAIRIEVMWRASVSQADIAKYVLTKLHNYGRAIGYLS